LLKKLGRKKNQGLPSQGFLFGALNVERGNAKEHPPIEVFCSVQRPPWQKVKKKRTLWGSPRQTHGVGPKKKTLDQEAIRVGPPNFADQAHILLPFVSCTGKGFAPNVP